MNTQYVVGERVVIRNGFSGQDPYRFGIITRVMASRVEVDGRESFTVATGKRVGDSTSFYADKIVNDISIGEAEAINENSRAEREHRRMAGELSSLSRSDWERLSAERLKTILAEVKTAKEIE